MTRALGELGKPVMTIQELVARSGDHKTMVMKKLKGSYSVVPDFCGIP